MPSKPTGTHLARHLPVVDGWRAISILLVLACHLFPVGPKGWHGNDSAGLAGMALFFTLSGFLICKALEQNPTVGSFLIRRLCRIVPLTFLALAVFLTIVRADLPTVAAHVLFYENYSAQRLTPLTFHFWSLCVEIHFYLAAAVLFALLGVRGLPLLAGAGVAITGLRLGLQSRHDIQTHLRVDEILTGVMLALIDSGRLGAAGRRAARLIMAVPLAAWLLLFVACCWDFPDNPLLYFRNYAALGLVGRTVLGGATPPQILASRPLRYIAEVSFAVYVIHWICLYGWLGSGDRPVRYAKRVIGLALTFGLAHLSTYYYERPWIALGKRWANRWDLQGTTPRAAQAGRRPALERLIASIRG